MDGDTRAPTPDREHPDRGKSVGSAAAYAGLGVQFLLAILLCLYAGRWVDAKLGTGPLFLVIGVFVGAAAGFWAILRRAADDQRREDQSRRS
jgi:ATP synthase protein I